jgi:hypothetical protein
MFSKKERKKEKETAQIRNSFRARVFNAGLLARSQFAFGRSCDRPIRSGFSVVFLGPRANAELVPKFHVALHASHAALKMLTFQNFAYDTFYFSIISSQNFHTPFLYSYCLTAIILKYI